MRTSRPVIDKITISDQDYARFSEYFYRKTGILFENSKRYFVDKRLVERVEATESHSFLSYFSMLRFSQGDSELQTLINLMTVNETYFFREEYQFKCLVNSMLNELITHKKPHEPIRIWSVPSSSGEEAYSIVIYLLEHWPALQQWDVEVISSDIDTDIIHKAEKGIYSQRSVQNLSDTLLKKYFRKVRDGYQIIDDLREAVQFTRVNLMNEQSVRGYQQFDVVFCRNLLIYFDDVSRRMAADTLYDALNPGGFVCLGHSESMSRISPLFKVRQFADAVVYQKGRDVV